MSIVVSTVGGLMDKDEKGFTQVGADRNYETMAFHSTEGDTKYHDADVGRQVYFQAPWMIKRLDRDNEANKMHECVVDEITRGLAGGLLYGGCNDE
ncbi:MAG: hypothetical protein GY851_07345 [bacterium]|nr:hypothetical protein [bacterium]